MDNPEIAVEALYDLLMSLKGLSSFLGSLSENARVSAPELEGLGRLLDNVTLNGWAVLHELGR